jgi:hypothetical protein
MMLGSSAWVETPSPVGMVLVNSFVDGAGQWYGLATLYKGNCQGTLQRVSNAAGRKRLLRWN